jgi:peptidoglycan/LPS O-acetylase OafA/YrhL
MLLSDLSHSPSFTALISRHPWPRRLLTLPLALLGLYIASFPGEHAEWVPWSNSMQQLSHYIFPPHVHVPKRYTALGLDMIILCIFLSPRTKDVLSSRLFLWFGKQSFAVYLIHGTLLRVPLMWMLYGITGQPWEEKIGEDGEVIRPEWLHRRTGVGFWVSIVAWIGLVYVCASLWTRYVDPWCARVTEWLEGKVGERAGEKEYIPMAVTPA